VLRFSYELTREVVEHTFLELLGLENLEVEDRGAVLAAISAWRDGVDFADALHLGSCRNADSFLTFDRRLAQAAGELSLAPPVELLEAE
jgi:predicted nucleic-acid-binding protein